MNKTGLRVFSQPQSTLPSEKMVTIALLVVFLVILPVLIASIVLAGIEYVTLRGEARQVISDVNLALGMLDHKADHLNHILLDWSAWDDLYAYAQDRDPAFASTNITAPALANMGINSQIILDASGNLIFDKTIDLSTGMDFPLPFEVNDLLEAYPVLLDHPTTSSSHVGLAVMADQVILAASRPITTGKYEGLAQGTLIFLIFLTPDQIDQLSALAQREIQLQILSPDTWTALSNDAAFTSTELRDDPVLAISGQDPFDQPKFAQNTVLDDEAIIYVKPLDNKTVSGFIRIQGLQPDTGILFRVITYRDLHQFGILTAIIFCILVELMGAVLFLVGHPFAITSVRSFKLSQEYLQRFQAVVRQMDEAILLIDPSLTILDASPTACEMFGMAEKMGEQITVFHLQDILKLAIELNQSTLDEISQHGRLIESQCTLRDGQIREVEINVRKIQYQDTLAYSLVLRDITNRINNEQALRASQERYQLAALGANDGIWDWNLMTNVFHYSPRWKTMLGYREDEIGGSPEEWMRRVHPDDRMNLQTQLSEHMRKRTKNFQCEHRLRHEDGDYRWMLARGVAIWNQDGYAYRMAGSLTDISAQKKIEEQLRHDALHDSLTGLGNRVLLLDRLRHVNERKKRQPEAQFAVFFLDLDRFKQVNDTLGHQAGDQALITCSNRLQTSLRVVDSITRYSGPETITRIAGDEFVLLVEDIKNPADALYIANRITQIISEPMIINGKEIALSTSLGIVVPQQFYKNPEDIIRDADIAMYQAKQKGAGNVVLFNNQMYENTLSRIETESELRRAIENKEFEVYYQPIYKLKDDDLIGFEALVRWNHPQRGLLNPGHFLQVAEETGLIIPIGNFVMEQACRQIRTWEIEFAPADPWFMSVNLSPNQLTSSRIIDDIQKTLNETRLDPGKLWLEVTENAVIQNIEEVRGKLEFLRSLGIHIKIDDFGTGYSSLSYLKNLPVDGIKIDRSFIEDMSFGSQQIIKTMLTLGKDLGLMQVAEGVETEAQRDYLRTLKCDYIQGFLMSRPIPAEKTTSLIRASLEHKATRYLVP